MKFKQISIVAFVFGALLMTGCTCSQSTDKEGGSATAQNDSNEEKVDVKNAFIVDVRTPAEFNEGSFKGAVNIPLSTVEENIEKFKGKEQVVVLCKSGTRAGKAINILEQHGISNPINAVNQSHLEELKKEEK